MKPETQKLVDKRNREAVKAVQELQKLPFSQEQIDKQVEEMFKVHNQPNPNKTSFNLINPLNSVM
jgi:hypothetical protein